MSKSKIPTNRTANNNPQVLKQQYIPALIWNKIIRFGFHLLYNQLAFSYDLVSWLVSLGFWRDWQRTALNQIHGPMVLEIAHGPGHMLQEMQQKGLQVTGIDLSSHMAKLAKKRTFKSSGGVDLIQCRAQHLPFTEMSFDSVLSTFPTDFFLQEETLLSVHSLLKENGCLIILPTARLSGNNILIRLIEWLYKITGQRSQILNESAAHIVQDNNSTDYLQQLFTSCGFALNVKNVTVKSSEVTLLIAKKS